MFPRLLSYNQLMTQPPPPEYRQSLERYFLSERTRLSTSGREEAGKFDRAILTFSVGTLVFSIEFLAKGTPGVAVRWILASSWLAAGVAFTATLLSFLFAQRAIGIEQTYLRALFDARMKGAEIPHQPNNGQAQASRISNVVSASAFVLSVWLLLTYVVIRWITSAGP